MKTSWIIAIIWLCSMSFWQGGSSDSAFGYWEKLGQSLFGYQTSIMDLSDIYGTGTFGDNDPVIYAAGGDVILEVPEGQGSAGF